MLKKHVRKVCAIKCGSWKNNLLLDNGYFSGLFYFKHILKVKI